MTARRVGLLALLLVWGAVGCASGDADPAEPSPATPASAEAEGVALDLPPGWRTRRPYQPPQITDPVVRLAVASAPVAIAPRGCHVGGYRIPERAAMVVVLEWRHRELQPRGPLPPPTDVRPADLHLRAGNVECFAGPGGSVQVGDGGRVWGAYVMLGRRAPARARAEALEVVRSLRATSPPEPLPGLFATTNDLALAGGRLWRASIRTVRTGQGGFEPTHRVEAFDPTTLREVGAPIGLPAAWGLVPGPARLWATGTGQLRLIDSGRLLRAGRIRGLDWAIGDLAVGERAAWVIESRVNRLRRIDTATGRVRQRWVRPTRQAMSALAMDGRALWVTSLGRRLPRPGVSPTPRGAGTLSRLDAGTGRVLGRLRVGRGPEAVAVGFGSIWVLNEVDGTLMRIAPGGPRVTSVIRLWSAGRSRPGARLAVGAGRVWALGRTGELRSVDPATDRMMRISTAPAGRSPTALAAGPEGAFVALTEPERICRVAVGSGRLDRDACAP